MEWLSQGPECSVIFFNSSATIKNKREWFSIIHVKNYFSNFTYYFSKVELWYCIVLPQSVYGGQVIWVELTSLDVQIACVDCLLFLWRNIIRYVFNCLFLWTPMVLIKDWTLSQVLSYDQLLEELDISNVRELEDFLINECIYAVGPLLL